MQEVEADIRDALNNLPPGLFGTYKRILDSISEAPSRRKIVRRVLTWLVFCKRPLTLTELAIGIAIDPEDKYFDETKKLPRKERILELCGSLVNHDSENDTVELAHISVRQFLMSETTPDASKNEYYICPIASNGEIMRSCLLIFTFSGDYERLDYYHDGNRMPSYTENHRYLLNYAVKKWPDHAKEVENHTKYYHLIASFFGDPSNRESFVIWARLRCLQSENSATEQATPKEQQSANKVI